MVGNVIVSVLSCKIKSTTRSDLSSRSCLDVRPWTHHFGCKNSDKIILTPISLEFLQSSSSKSITRKVGCEISARGGGDGVGGATYTAGGPSPGASWCYSSTSSQSINAASVPPVLTIHRSLNKNRALLTAALYVFTSLYSALGLAQGYLKI